MIRKKSLPHALLFAGMEGVGKLTAALTAAMALNCGSADDSVDPCGLCRSCKKIRTGLHPDVITVEPSGKFIRIDQIRELLYTLTLKPFEAKTRVVVIKDAQKMNTESANALLKELEEPPANTIFILTAPQVFDLMPTIRSRSQPVRFHPIPFDVLKIFLETEHDLDADGAQEIARLSEGSYSRALSMIDPGVVSRKSAHEAMIRKLEPYQESGQKPGQQSGQARQIETLMALAEKLAVDQDRASECLDLLKLKYRDLAVSLKHGKFPGTEVNMEKIIANFHAVESAQRKIRANGNLRLTLENMFLSLRAV